MARGGRLGPVPILAKPKPLVKMARNINRGAEEDGAAPAAAMPRGAAAPIRIPFARLDLKPTPPPPQPQQPSCNAPRPPPSPPRNAPSAHRRPSTAPTARRPPPELATTRARPSSARAFTQPKLSASAVGSWSRPGSARSSASPASSRRLVPSPEPYYDEDLFIFGTSSETAAGGPGEDHDGILSEWFTIEHTRPQPEVAFDWMVPAPPLAIASPSSLRSGSSSPTRRSPTSPTAKTWPTGSAARYIAETRIF